MRKLVTTLAVATVMIAGHAAGSVAYADDAQGTSGSMMGNGMMSQGGMMGDGQMMGRGGMMGMRHMGGMMNHCDSMMRDGTGGGRPNDRWHRPAPNNNG